MKLKNLLQRVELFSSTEERHRLVQRDEMRKVLKKLKKKEQKLKEEAANAEDAERRSALETKLKMMHAQRKKNIAMLKSTKTRE